MIKSLPQHTPRWIETVLHSLRDPIGGARLIDVDANDQHSNDVFELRFDDGRALMLKRGRHEWSAAMFARSAAASRLLRSSSDIVAPVPLPLPGSVDGHPVQAYWRIALPTLGEVWPRLDDAARVRALASCGALARRLHAVRSPGWGPLGPTGPQAPTLAAYLEADLAGRLLPAVAAIWPEALGSLQAMIGKIPTVARRVGTAEGVLVHSDLHLGNVLCTVEDDEVRCVGLIDLDAAMVGPPEADLASFETLHGPLFEQTIEARLQDGFRTGYGSDADPLVLGFFRAVHLANMGFHSALLGHDLHAGEVARALRAEVDALEKPMPATPLRVSAVRARV